MRSLGASLDRPGDEQSFARLRERATPLPDLSGLFEGIEWSVDVNGVRRGELDLGALFPGRATLYQFEMRVERP